MYYSSILINAIVFFTTNASSVRTTATHIEHPVSTPVYNACCWCSSGPFRPFTATWLSSTSHVVSTERHGGLQSNGEGLHD
jgi:hypothetical protein